MTEAVVQVVVKLQPFKKEAQVSRSIQNYSVLRGGNYSLILFQEILNFYLFIIHPKIILVSNYMLAL